MKRTHLEKNIVVALFILVIVVFSFAERDSKKLNQLYTKGTESFEPLKKQQNLASTESTSALPVTLVSN